MPSVSLVFRAKSLVKLWVVWMNSYQIRGVATTVPVIRNVTTVHDARQNIFHVRPGHLNQKKKGQSNETERNTKQKTKQRSNYYQTRMLGITTTPHISVVVVWCSAVVASTCSTTTTKITFSLRPIQVFNTWAQTVKSPTLKEYFLLQPCCPNRRLPCT